jgi:hypothetical protein
VDRLGRTDARGRRSAADELGALRGIILGNMCVFGMGLAVGGGVVVLVLGVFYDKPLFRTGTDWRICRVPLPLLVLAPDRHRRRRRDSGDRGVLTDSAIDAWGPAPPSTAEDVLREPWLALSKVGPARAGTVALEK